MEQEASYSNPHVSVFIDEAVRAVRLEWKGFASSSEFKEGCEASLEQLKIHGFSKMIADNRAGKAIDPADQRWLSEQWFPRAIKAGFRHSAVILSQSGLNKHATETISRTVSGELFQTKNVRTLEEARDWLLDI